MYEYKYWLWTFLIIICPILISFHGNVESVNVSPQVEMSMQLESMHRDKIILEKRLEYYKKRIRIPITVSAYSPRQCETDSTPTINAANKFVTSGTVALSRDIEELYELKFGDIIFIEGFGYFKFEDRMNKRMKMCVDIFMWDTREAQRFGLVKSFLVIDDVM